VEAFSLILQLNFYVGSCSTLGPMSMSGPALLRVLFYSISGSCSSQSPVSDPVQLFLALLLLGILLYTWSLVLCWDFKIGSYSTVCLGRILPRRVILRWILFYVGSFYDGSYSMLGLSTMDPILCSVFLRWFYSTVAHSTSGLILYSVFRR
jgi:hypothetical protein